MENVFNLEGKTKKGRERVKRDGAEGWKVLKVADRVIFSSLQGPWLFMSRGGPGHPSSRWIHKTNDTDFRVVEAGPMLQAVK